MIKDHERHYIDEREDKSFVCESVGKVYFESGENGGIARSQSFGKHHQNDLSKLAGEFVVTPDVAQTIFELYSSPDATVPAVVEEKYILRW